VVHDRHSHMSHDMLTSDKQCRVIDLLWLALEWFHFVHVSDSVVLVYHFNFSCSLVLVQGRKFILV